MKVALHGMAALLLCISPLALGQHTSETATPLSQLLNEGAAANPDISAADHAWKAASHKVAQASTLPDPKLTVQHFTVGSPRPFAGYTNSDFAYVGVGASQELPYPGKLRLRGAVAAGEAQSLHAQVNVAQAALADGIKADYIQLAYLQETFPLLEANKAELDQLIKDATLHYEVGQGMQQDVLQAQIERTKLVREVAMHHERVAEVEAHLKGLLHRDQMSPDIVAQPLDESSLKMPVADLMALVRAQNPQVQADAHTSGMEEARVASARREGKPDFELGYMYQNTDRKYRDYYMLTLQMTLPRKKRVDAEVAEAAERFAQSADVLDAHVQERMTEVRQQYAKATSASEILADYREGLVPQSEAAYRATLNAYSSNREQFAHVVTSFLTLLNLREEVLQTLADHETALAHLETLTGASLR